MIWIALSIRLDFLARLIAKTIGEMAEWSKAPVLKTGKGL